MWTTLGASRACETSQKLIKILRSARLRPQVGYIPARTKTETETETATKTFSLLSTPALVLPMQKRNSKRKLHFNCFRAEPLDLYAVTLLLINKICERALAQLSVTTTTLCAEQQSQRQSLMECIVGGAWSWERELGSRAGALQECWSLLLRNGGKGSSCQLRAASAAAPGKRTRDQQKQNVKTKTITKIEKIS